MEIIFNTPTFAKELLKEEIKKFIKKSKIIEIAENKIKVESELESIRKGIGQIRLAESFEFEGRITSLEKRKFRENKQDIEISPILINYLFYELGIDKAKKVSVVDPIARQGNLILESSIFIPRENHITKEMSSIKELKLAQISGLTNTDTKIETSYTAILQDSKTFKEIRENIALCGKKIKTSQFDLSWLDVKFHKGDFDYCVSFFDKSLDENSQFLDQYFYMTEFITKKKIGIISEFEIKKKYYSKYNLKLEKQENLTNKTMYLFHHEP